jgi:hypothetical protein
VVQTLAEAMGLKTAWAFLWTEAGLYTATDANDPPHDFALAACCGLPPALEQENRRCLCQPPDCYCQTLLRNGQLVRAVNIVECTRLQHAARYAGDTEGLLFHATVPLHVQNRPAGLINVATEQWEFLSPADLQFLSAAAAHVSIALSALGCTTWPKRNEFAWNKNLQWLARFRRVYCQPSRQGSPGSASWRIGVQHVRLRVTSLTFFRCRMAVGEWSLPTFQGRARRQPCIWQ